jgi:nanoRNase/pAp phosphatase (c-di-AMP/oligoRNAs hydrolase)
MRLITRSDFDGLVCAVLLKEAGIIDDYKFAHPKDIQDGKVVVDGNDVLANVPFMAGCGLWFDHHVSEEDVREVFGFEFQGDSRPAKSCARIVYDYYGGAKKFGRFEEMLEATDRSDSGDLTQNEILSPEGWILLSFIMDPRTGLGRYKDYRISNYQLMENLVDYCRTKTIGEIIDIEDVQERVRRYRDHTEIYKDMLRDNSRVDDNVLIIDLRKVFEIFAGNRFVEYCLFPDQNISIRAMWGLNKQNVVFAMGHSVINRSSKTNVGLLLHKYGGGGHSQVGTCQVPVSDADFILRELIRQTREDA